MLVRFCNYSSLPFFFLKPLDLLSSLLIILCLDFVTEFTVNSLFFYRLLLVRFWFFVLLLHCTFLGLPVKVWPLTIRMLICRKSLRFGILNISFWLRFGLYWTGLKSGMLDGFYFWVFKWFCRLGLGCFKITVFECSVDAMGIFLVW